MIEVLNSKKQNYVLAFWHGTMILPWYLHGSPGFAALTSKSKDGDLLAKILKKWNYRVVRGSSSTGGDVALGIMVDYAKNKYSIAITPDGPRGPKQKFKAGAVITAKKSNIPIILAGVGFKRKKILDNWDRFEIPYFFTTAKIIYSEPIYIESNLSYEETSAVISKCDEELNRLQQSAQNFSN
ncbi:MAG: lysophospholipid acyltransferase family protein [Ignavibacteriaceae bacterium]|nr:lysophospholipid acyltransferase family protein [Ignavibacteriaceae bacterium]